MNALNLNNIIFTIGEENGIISDFWKDTNVVSLSNDFSNSIGGVLGGLSQTLPNGVPTINFSIEKPLTFNEKILDYFLGEHNVSLVEASIDNLESQDTLNVYGANFNVVMTEYSISLTAGEVPLLSASFIGEKVYESKNWEVIFEKSVEEKEIPKMDRISPYLDIFNDEAIYSINFSERKNVSVRWPINWQEKIFILESPLINQELSASGYAPSLSNFPFNDNIDLIENYLNQKNEVFGIKIQSEKVDGGTNHYIDNDYFLKNPRLNSLNINMSDSDYLSFNIGLMGSRTIIV